MRLGLELDSATALGLAAAADANGLAAVLVPGGEFGEGIALASAIAATTSTVRIAVVVPLGVEHPVTIAEEVAVLDHLSAGRVTAVLDTRALSLGDAREEVELLRECWSGRWISHRGPRWTVPAGLHGEESPEAIAVTPFPAQLELPVWLTGHAATALGHGLDLPFLRSAATELAGVSRVRTVPGRARLSGDPDADRVLLRSWVSAHASIVFLRLPEGADADFVQQHIARHLVGEVATPSFPRVIAESPWPLAWSPDSNEK